MEATSKRKVQGFDFNVVRNNVTAMDENNPLTLEFPEGDYILDLSKTYLVYKYKPGTVAGANI